MNILQEGSLIKDRFFHSGTCECFEEMCFFFSEGEYVTNFVYRGTGCIGTNCSLTKCLCTAGRERNIMGQSKNSSISGRDSGWKCLILLKC